jgi:hypothetical protein
MSETMTIGAIVLLPASAAVIAIMGGSVLQVLAPFGVFILLTRSGLLEG